VREGLRTARWPARLEEVARRPTVLLDGAHNPHAARALAHAVPALAGSRPVQLVFAAMSDKDHAAMLRELLPLAAGAHLCAVESSRAAPPEQLAKVARELGARSSPTYRTVREALQAARAAAGPDGWVLCCGSLYLAAEVRAALDGHPAAPTPSERL
jgi:folylpolyglutamate synthase/dihydropteroate synthase